MNILLVEDELPKREHIKNFIESLDLNIIIDCAFSVTSGLDKLDSKVPELLLLDMSLPTFDVDIDNFEIGGRPQGFGGIEILRNLKYDKIICKTIVITGYEAFLKEEGKSIDLIQIKVDLLKKYPEYIVDVLHFNSTYDSWKQLLKQAILDYYK